LVDCHRSDRRSGYDFSCQRQNSVKINETAGELQLAEQIQVVIIFSYVSCLK
jgi:hypothetical protein